MAPNEGSALLPKTADGGPVEECCDQLEAETLLVFETKRQGRNKQAHLSLPSLIWRMLVFLTGSSFR
jgi:hypothetical protein